MLSLEIYLRVRAVRLTGNMDIFYLSHSTDTNDNPSAKCTMYHRCVTSRCLSVCREKHRDSLLRIFRLSILATINNAPHDGAKRTP